MTEMLKKELTTELIHERLTQAAQIENDPHYLRLIEIHDSLAEQLESLATQINDIEKPARTIRNELKDEIKTVVFSGGEVDHALVTVKTRKKWEYDRDAALEWAKEYDPKSVKSSLIVRSFEKNLPITAMMLFPAEQVEETVIALPKDLSHLLISEDAE